MSSHVELKLASLDMRFQAALAEANALYDIHHGARGAQFEHEARSILASFLPYTHQVHDGFMAPVAGLTKQLDVLIRSRFLPELWQVVPVELITVAGEIKTKLGGNGKADYLATAAKLAGAMRAGGRTRPLPFFALAGELERSTDHAAWLASVVRDASATAADLWPAAFSFDTRAPMSAVPVGPTTPLSAVTADGEGLSGVISITADQLSPSAVCYFWLWACLYNCGEAQGLESQYMREALRRELTSGHGLAASFMPLRGDNGMRQVTVGLDFTDEAGHAVHRSAAYVPWPSGPEVVREPKASPDVKPPAGEPGSRRFMLITLAPWVEEIDTWDESLWGGSGTASRRGHGYYDGMTDQELLDASRLFWRFRPNSGTWDGIDHAVVSFNGTIRAVLKITQMIGPLWDRHGFQGYVLKDSKLTRDLIGQAVPARRNPITTVEL
jgi:hypothetical protein